MVNMTTVKVAETCLNAEGELTSWCVSDLTSVMFVVGVIASILILTLGVLVAIDLIRRVRSVPGRLNRLEHEVRELQNDEEGDS